MLFDQFGRPIQARDVRRPETREISVQQVRDRWSTYPSSGLTPERLASILRAADNGDVLRQAELFEEMEEKDPHLASQFQTRKLAVQGLPWEVLPASEDARDKEIAAYCSESLSGLADLDDHILDMLDALPKGYSVMEIMWDTGTDQARLSGLRWVHPKKVTFWDSIHPRILTGEEPVRGIEPPPFKFVYHRYKARSGYDTRAGIMRVCAWMYLFKNYAVKDWVAFAEIFGMPIRVGKYEPGASKGDREALLNAIRSLGSDAAGIISKSTEIEFIEAQKSGSGSAQNIYQALAAFCDAQVSKAILGQTLTSDAGGERGQGSYALGRVHNEVRQDLIEADCKALGKTITQQIVRPLVGFNFGWDAPVPQFRFLYEAPEDLLSAANIYQIVCGSLGQPVSQEHISSRFKIPLPQQGETLLAVPSSSPNSVPLPIASKVVGKSGISERTIEGVLEVSTDKILPQATDELQKMLAPVLEFINQAGSLDEVAKGIEQLFPNLDSRELQNLLTKAMFGASLTGASAVEGE